MGAMQDRGSIPLRRTAIGALVCTVLAWAAPLRAEGLESAPPARVPEGSIERGTLRGTLVDADTGTPVSGAEIRLVVAGVSRIADTRGRFSFGNRDVLGPDTIVVRHILYDSLRLSIGDRDLGPIDLELHLTQRPIPLDGLEVTVANVAARAEARRVADRYEGRLWPREEFDSFVLTAESAVDPLRWAPGVTQVVEGHDGYRCVILRVRHGCASVYVDGNPIPNEHLVNVTTDIIDSYVIFGPVEAAFIYGGSGSSGIVMIFTRR